MICDKKHIRHCILFSAFQLKQKRFAEAVEMVCYTLGESAAIHMTCKNWYKRFRRGDSNLLKTKTCQKFKDEKLRHLSRKAQFKQERTAQVSYLYK